MHKEKNREILSLREAMEELEISVLNSYGWADIKLDLGFSETTAGTRFGISDNSKDEILQRLLDLNLTRTPQNKGS